MIIIDQQYLASVWILDVLLRRDLQTVTELSACPCLYRGQPTHCCRRIYFSTYPYLKQTIFNTWLLGLSPDLRVYCKIFQYLLTFCLNSMETSNPLSSMWQKIDRFILQMYNFPYIYIIYPRYISYFSHKLKSTAKTRQSSSWTLTHFKHNQLHVMHHEVKYASCTSICLLP